MTNPAYTARARSRPTRSLTCLFLLEVRVTVRIACASFASHPLTGEGSVLEFATSAALPQACVFARQCASGTCRALSCPPFITSLCGTIVCLVHFHESEGRTETICGYVLTDLIMFYVSLRVFFWIWAPVVLLVYYADTSPVLCGVLVLPSSGWALYRLSEDIVWRPVVPCAQFLVPCRHRAMLRYIDYSRVVLEQVSTLCFSMTRLHGLVGR